MKSGEIENFLENLVFATCVRYQVLDRAFYGANMVYKGLPKEILSVFAQKGARYLDYTYSVTPVGKDQRKPPAHEYEQRFLQRVSDPRKRPSNGVDKRQRQISQAGLNTRASGSTAARTGSATIYSRKRACSLSSVRIACMASSATCLLSVLKKRTKAPMGQATDASIF